MERLRIWQIVTVFLTLVCLGLIIALAVNMSKDEAPEIETCPEPQTTQSQRQTVEQLGIFEDLTEEELKAVRDYMQTNAQLNITPHSQANINNNYIFLIELYPPSKTEALEFLDNNGAKPGRVAKVVVHGGGLSIPVIEEYLVQPAHKPTSHLLTTDTTTVNPIPFYTRPGDAIEDKGLDQLIFDATSKLYKFLFESYDGFVYHNCTDKCLGYALASPDTQNGGRKAWVEFVLKIVHKFIWSIDLNMLVDQSGTDISKWKILKVVYNDQQFDSVDNLMDLYNRNLVNKTSFKVPANLESLDTDYYPKGGNPRYQPQPAPGPEIFEPAGNRFKVRGHHVEYMDWSFDFRLSSVTGVQVYDIKFNDERIVYELSLQEAASMYSAYAPIGSYANYLDTGYGMGGSYNELVPGWDCPSTAVFSDLIQIVNSGEPVRTKGGMCIFEWASDVPLRRHHDSYGPKNTFYGGVKDHALVIRSIATIENYDYIYDYRFHLNGVVEVKVYLTGYVLVSSYGNKETKYAFRVMETGHGNIHDHFLHFKVDLDIAGRNNNFEHVSVKTEEVDGWENDKITKKYLTREVKKTEKAAAYKYDFSKPKYLNFYNKDSQNKLGEDRGYRIHVSSPVYQIYDDANKNVAMIPWTKYQVAVTKHKETERTSSSLYNQKSAYNPIVNFDSFVNDDENIENQDIVAWVSVGKLHVPGSEDIPNTETMPNQVGFTLQPFNFFDINPSVRTRNALIIKPGKDGGTQVEDFGSSAQGECVPKKKKISYTGF